jgi:hypothetical protein
MPSRILAAEDRNFQNEGHISRLLENFHVPILPKIGVYMNTHALIISSVTTMIVGIWTKFQWSTQLYDLNCLIPCFMIGLICGGASVAFGFLSLQLRDCNPSTESGINRFVYVFKSSNLLLSASVTLMVISNIIFLAVGGCSLYVVVSLF